MTTKAKQTAKPYRPKNHNRFCANPVGVVFEESESTPNEPISQEKRELHKAMSDKGMERSKVAIHG